MTKTLLYITVLSLLVLFLLAGCSNPKQGDGINVVKTSSRSKEKPLSIAKQVSAPKTNADEKFPMIPGKPLFSIKLDFISCPHKVYLNGGLVTSNTTPSPDEGEYPVNHWLRSGANEIEIQMLKWPDKPDRCHIKLDLLYRDANSKKEDDPGYTVFILAHSAKNAAAGNPVQGSSPPGLLDSKHSFKTSEQGDVLVGPAEISRLSGRGSFVQVLRRSFNFSVPFPEWAFFQGDTLKVAWDFEKEEDLDSIYNEIYAAYLNVWKLLAARDVAGFLVACEERSREMDIAYYRKSGETRAKLRHDLEVAMKDPDLKLATLDLPPGNSWTYNVGSKGNLIALTQEPDADSIFRFQQKSGPPFSYVFPVVFRKEGDRYIVTR